MIPWGITRRKCYIDKYEIKMASKPEKAKSRKIEYEIAGVKGKRAGSVSSNPRGCR